MRKIPGTLGPIAHVPGEFFRLRFSRGSQVKVLSSGCDPVKLSGRPSIFLFGGRRQWAQAPSNVYFCGYPAAVEIVVALEGSAQIA